MTRVRYVSAVKYTEHIRCRRGLFNDVLIFWDRSYAALGSHELLPLQASAQNARQSFAPTQKADWRGAGDDSDEQMGSMRDVCDLYRSERGRRRCGV